MTKEQIQEAAEREYPNKPEGPALSYTRCRQQAFVAGANYALNSDTVKGMAEALEKAEWILENYAYLIIPGKELKNIKAAIRNYEQSIKAGTGSTV